MGLMESWMGHVDAIRSLVLGSGRLIFADTNE